MNPTVATPSNPTVSPQSSDTGLMRFGNDIVVNTPGVSTGAGAQKDYSVLDFALQSFLDQHLRIQQTLQTFLLLHLELPLLLPR